MEDLWMRHPADAAPPVMAMLALLLCRGLTSRRLRLGLFTFPALLLNWGRHDAGSLGRWFSNRVLSRLECLGDHTVSSCSMRLGFAVLRKVFPVERNVLDEPGLQP